MLLLRFCVLINFYYVFIFVCSCTIFIMKQMWNVFSMSLFFCFSDVIKYSSSSIQLFISCTKLHHSDEIRYIVSWINSLQNDVNVFHLTWITSLHYLVKREMLIRHVLPLSCHRKSFTIHPTSSVAQIHQIWIQSLASPEFYIRSNIKHFNIWNSEYKNVVKFCAKKM